MDQPFRRARGYWRGWPRERLRFGPSHRLVGTIWHGDLQVSNPTLGLGRRSMRSAALEGKWADWLTEILLFFHCHVSKNL